MPENIPSPLAKSTKSAPDSVIQTASSGRMLSNTLPLKKRWTSYAPPGMASLSASILSTESSFSGVLPTGAVSSSTFVTFFCLGVFASSSVLLWKLFKKIKKRFGKEDHTTTPSGSSGEQTRCGSGPDT